MRNDKKNTKKLSLYLWLSLILFLSPLSLGESIEIHKIRTLSTGWTPKSILISGDKKVAYTMNLEGMSVYAFSTMSQEILWKVEFYRTPAPGWNYTENKPISSYAEKPVEAVLTENDRYLWVSLHNGAKVVRIDTFFPEAVEPSAEEIKEKHMMKIKKFNKNEKTFQEYWIPFVEVGKTPKVIVKSPDEKVLYVSNWHSHNISVIDPQSLQVTHTIPVDRIPRGMAFTPDSKYVYVANMGSDSVQKIDVAQAKIVKTIRVGINPRHIVMNPNGQEMYITLNSQGKLVFYDVANDKVKTTISTGRSPRTAVISPDGKYLFITQYQVNQLSIVNIAKMALEKTVPTNIHPIGVDVVNHLVWVVNYTDSTINIFEYEDSVTEDSVTESSSSESSYAS